MSEIILNKARELFFSYGLKNVSMDDLARNAGVSKKTIYLYFEDKSALVSEVLKALVEEQKFRFKNCRKQAVNAVHEFSLQAEIPYDAFSCIKTGFFIELEKTFPALYSNMMEYRRKILLPGFRENIVRGIEEGLYRSEINPELMAELRLQHIINALNPENLTEKRTDSLGLYHELNSFFLHAITTTKGKNLISKYLTGK